VGVEAFESVQHERGRLGYQASVSVRAAKTTTTQADEEIEETKILILVTFTPSVPSCFSRIYYACLMTILVAFITFSHITTHPPTYLPATLWSWVRLSLEHK